MQTARIPALAASSLAALALAAALAGCSDDKKSDTPTPTTAAATTPAGGGTTAASSASNGGGGASSATVGGKKVEGNLTASCVKQGDNVVLALADAGNPTAVIGATVSGTTVTTVGIAGLSGGLQAVAYAPGTPNASASVKVDGTTYTVEGKGIDSANPLGGPTDFSIVFACTSIVGG